jgi:hypothetical protein
MASHHGYAHGPICTSPAKRLDFLTKNDLFMKKIVIELKWALIFALMTLIWVGLEKAVGLHSTYIDKHPIYTNFIAIPAIALYVFALLDKRKNSYHGSMSWRQGLVSGGIISLIICILSPITQSIVSLVISPEFFPNAIGSSVKSGYFKTQAEAEAYFNLKNYVVQGLLGALVMGLATSAIVAIFVRKEAS